MSLAKYLKKRAFDSTPEPKGGKVGASQLKFVVQKHNASHLHYDFRLEMEGVLKSWAVPKGPSMDPKVKRLAMMVEDHPFDYRNFEGIIPEGNYGAGTVIVWDEGTYVSTEVEGGKSDHDKNLRHQLHKGKIHFMLNGTKLKGEFALVKSHGRGENSWLLMKLKDEFATTNDITLKETSIISKKTIEQVAATSKNIYGGKSAAAPAKKSVPRKTKSVMPSKKKPAKSQLKKAVSKKS